MSGLEKVMDGIERIPHLIRQLYSVVAELERLSRVSVHPDGHLFGSIGEVLAASHYGLTLLSASTEGHEAMAEDGGLVQ